MIQIVKRMVPVLLATLAFACGTEAGPQVVSGRAALSSFPAGVTQVNATRAGVVVASAPVGADGSFSLAIPADGGRYRIELASANGGATTLVFPRRDGSIDTSFRVHRAGAARDLGQVVRIGDARKMTYSFAADCVDETGTVCVDETDGANNQDGVDEADGDNNQCGVDEPDGDNNNQDGVDEAAVGDNNLAADVGCEGGEDGDQPGGTDDGPGTDEPGTDQPGDPPAPPGDVPVIG